MATLTALIGGGIKSIQTGYVTGSTTGTGEDLVYADDTVSAVVVANSVVFAFGSNTNFGGANLTGRMTSTTNVRVSDPINASGTIRARYYIVEYE